MNKLLLSLLLVTASSAVNANLIQNGSFEDINVSDGSYSVVSGSTLSGWAVTSGSGVEIRNNIVGAASQGSNYVELDSFSNSSIAQTVLATADTFYDLIFDYSPRIGELASTNGISVFWNGVLLANGEITADGTANTANMWVAQQFSVAGSSTGSNVLQFIATGDSDGLGGNIDNVSLVKKPDAPINSVPLPTAGWLFASAIGLFGFARRSSV